MAFAAQLVTTSIRLFADQRIRFIIVGGINTAVGYGAFAALVFMKFHYLAANLCATVIGVLCSYILNKYFTFRCAGKSAAEFCRFIMVYIISFVVGNLSLLIFVEWLGLTPYLAGCFNLILTALISWFGHKHFSFKEIGARGK